MPFDLTDGVDTVHTIKAWEHIDPEALSVVRGLEQDPPDMDKARKYFERGIREALHNSQCEEVTSCVGEQDTQQRPANRYEHLRRRFSDWFHM
jgi:hypothetical protein